jgi:hypothetical protein
MTYSVSVLVLASSFAGAQPAKTIEACRLVEEKSVLTLGTVPVHFKRSPLVLTSLVPIPKGKVQSSFEPGPSTFAFSPTSNKIASRSSLRITFWSLETGKELQTIRNPEVVNLKDVQGDFPDLAFSPDGSLLAAGGFDGKVHIFKVENAELIRSLEAETIPACKLFFSENGLSAIYRKPMGSKHGITLLSWDTGKWQKKTIDLGEWERPLWAVSGSGKKVAVGSMKESVSDVNTSDIDLWDAGSGKKTQLKPGLLNMTLAFENENLLVVSRDKNGSPYPATIFSAGEKNAIKKLEVPYRVYDFSVSPDGEFYLIRGGTERSDVCLRLVEAKTGMERWSSGARSTGRFSPGGVLVALVGSGLNLLAVKDMQNPMWAEKAEGIHKVRLIDGANVEMYKDRVSLSIFKSPIDAMTVKTLCDSVSFATRFEFRFCTGITGKVLEPLKGLSRLEELDLQRGEKLTDDDLASIRDLTSLKYLGLENCPKLSGAALVHLRGLKRLERLTVPLGSKITGTDLDALKTVLPKCQIVMQK